MTQIQRKGKYISHGGSHSEETKNENENWKVFFPIPLKYFEDAEKSIQF